MSIRLAIQGLGTAFAPEKNPIFSLKDAAFPLHKAGFPSIVAYQKEIWILFIPA